MFCYAIDTLSAIDSKLKPSLKIYFVFLRIKGAKGVSPDHRSIADGQKRMRRSFRSWNRTQCQWQIQQLEGSRRIPGAFLRHHSRVWVQKNRIRWWEGSMNYRKLTQIAITTKFLVCDKTTSQLHDLILHHNLIFRHDLSYYHFL